MYDNQEWIDAAALALDAATTIGMRSCSPGDGLNYGNHDRLLASKPTLGISSAWQVDAATERILDRMGLTEHTQADWDKAHELAVAALDAD